MTKHIFFTLQSVEFYQLDEEDVTIFLSEIEKKYQQIYLSSSPVVRRAKSEPFTIITFGLGLAISMGPTIIKEISRWIEKLKVKEVEVAIQHEDTTIKTKFNTINIDNLNSEVDLVISQLRSTMEDLK